MMSSAIDPADATAPPLRGWKTIAGFLAELGGPGSERQARSYGALGLPYYQPDAHSPVVAYRDEIRLWWHQRLRSSGTSDGRRALPSGIVQRAKT